MSLYMSAFEDLLAMKTRAFLVKDIDPEILQRLLGTRSLATQLNQDELTEFFVEKTPIPTDAKGLLHLMNHGGGLDREFQNPLYREKLQGLEIETIRGWVEELCQQGKITKLDGTGAKELDGKWFSNFMAEIHGTLGCLVTNGGKEVDDLTELQTRGLTYKIATAFDKTTPTQWQNESLGDPKEAIAPKSLKC